MFGARLIVSFVLLIFIADAINVDVLYAMAIGDLQFQDNPDIFDSQFDSTPVCPAPTIATHGPRNSTLAQRALNHKFRGTIILEDIDSPTVLDGTVSSNLLSSVLEFFVQKDHNSSSAILSFDRTISFQRLLI